MPHGRLAKAEEVAAPHRLPGSARAGSVSGIDILIEAGLTEQTPLVVGGVCPYSPVSRQQREDSPHCQHLVSPALGPMEIPRCARSPPSPRNTRVKIGDTGTGPRSVSSADVSQHRRYLVRVRIPDYRWEPTRRNNREGLAPDQPRSRRQLDRRHY